MNCHEAAEYASVLCDGKTIPRDAAEHIGGCATCRARLREYLEIGAELRRVASLAPEQELKPRSWDKPQRSSTWWSKGVETMRVPRFAFALLLLTIVGLASGLVMLRARAQNQEAVLMLTAKQTDGHLIRCALSLQDKTRGSCVSVGNRDIIGFRVASSGGDEIKLGVRARVGPPGVLPRKVGSWEDIKDLPEKTYSFRPGQELRIGVPGFGRMVVTGELVDHMPPVLVEMGVRLDPDPGTLQVISPILISRKEVLCDFHWGSAIDRSGVMMYVPGSGLWTFSLRPLQGAVEGKVDQNRVSFELDGRGYTLVSGAPVARGERIWVLHDAGFRPEGSPNAAFITVTSHDQER